MKSILLSSKGLAGGVFLLIIGAVFNDDIARIYQEIISPTTKVLIGSFKSWMTSSRFSPFFFTTFIFLCVLVLFFRLTVLKLNKTKSTLKESDLKINRLEEENTRLSDYYEKQLRKDSLTGVPNSRALDDFFDSDYKEFVNENRPSTFVLLDIRNFGKLNEKYGKFKCDAFLRKLAPFIDKQLRRNEGAFRIHSNHETLFRMHTGGDEFLLAIRGNETDGMFLAKRLLEEISIESQMWGRSLGVDSYLPTFNVAVYQSIQGTQWLGSLLEIEKPQETLGRAFPKSNRSLDDKIQWLQEDGRAVAKKIARLADDDQTSILEAVFELLSRAKTNPHCVAVGRDHFHSEYIEYVDLITFLSSEKAGDHEFAQMKLNELLANLSEN